VLAFASSFSPALAHAQEGWIGGEQAPAPAVPVGPVATPPPSVPFAPAVPLPQRTEMRSLKLTVGGVIMASIGTAFLVGGIVGYEKAMSPSCPQPETLGCGLGSAIGAVGNGFWPLVLAVFGGTMVVPGVVMIGVGASPVPARRGWERPDVSIGPGSGRLTWSF
jgi:hypothetical protein